LAFCYGMGDKMQTRTVFGIAMMVFCVSLGSISAGASDFTLEIFGNANMDDTIDELDIEYVQGIIDGTNDDTEFADANYDGQIDEVDLEQIQAILDGRETKLTYIDMLDEPETVNKPIKRLVNMGYNGVEMTRILGAEDILVAYGQDRTAHKTFFPKFDELPFVGNTAENADFEIILSLEPDAIQTNIESGHTSPGGLEQKQIFKQNFPGVPIISLNMREPDTMVKNVRTYGYIIDRVAEAEEFIDWYSGYYDLFKSRTEAIPDDERPTAFIEYTPYYCYASGSRLGQVIVLAGGKNVVDDIVGPDHPSYRAMLDVDPEFIIEENPEYIFKAVGSWDSGYDIDDASEMAALREEVTSRPELANTDAVKNDNVYSMSFWVLSGAGNNIIGTAYLAKLFYPDLFQDIDPQAIHQEYVDKFCHIDFDIKEHGSFVYPDYDEWPFQD